MEALRLRGSLTVLRDFSLDDIDAAFAIVGDDRVTRSLSFDSRSRPEAQAMITGAVERAAFRPRTEYYLAVTVDDTMIGFARLALAGVSAAKLGYAIGADHWGHGYGTDAARTLTDFAFTTLQVHRVSAATAPDNTASIALLKRLGFVYEGRIRDHVFTNGAWRDSLLYSVLAPEWEARLATRLHEVVRDGR